MLSGTHVSWYSRNLGKEQTTDKEKFPWSHELSDGQSLSGTVKPLISSQLEEESTARSSNQSILKGINPEYSSEGLLLKLKKQSFGHLM